jgi:hypothetical protein
MAFLGTTDLYCNYLKNLARRSTSLLPKKILGHQSVASNRTLSMMLKEVQ